MDVLEAIRTRRTAGRMKPDAPSREAIEELLEAATWAPNHHLNEPWQFFVLTGEARQRFGQVMAEDACRSLPDPTGEQARALADAQMKKAVRSPVVIAAVVDPPNGPKIVDVEDVAAVACAIQNLLLAAHARGFATKWSTGGPARSEIVKRFFGLSPAHQILGFIYLGYPDEERTASLRRGHREKVTWLG
ncbi:MAG: nitroreductase [Chloroflexi bacterium]|nr:nitroreductase [Chloroflexota bacterium]